MKKAILKITILSLFAAAFVAAPLAAHAQVATNTTAATATGKKAKKSGALVTSTGKVSAVDTNALTLTVGKHVLGITSETKITKDGQPATLADAIVGEAVSCSYKKDAAGKLIAMTVSYTTKAAGTKKKKQLSTGGTGATNSTTK